MSFCDLCNGLTIEKSYPPNIYYHAENLAALEQSGESCRLCAFMHWCITRTDNPDCFHLTSTVPLPAKALPRLETTDDALITEETDEVHDEFKFRLTKPLDSFRVKLQIILEPAIKPTSYREDADGFTHVGIWLNAGRMRTDMTIAVEEGDHLASCALNLSGINKYIYGRILTGRILPKAQFDVARDWLQRCETEHMGCNDLLQPLPRLPTRVIQIARDNSLRLIEGLGQHARYATLSHCWGKTAMLAQTTKHNLPQRQAHIAFEKLPKTFQDAVVVCRELAIDHLWIDTLCIVQDSEEDWEVQSSEMGSIYYNSTLTLAAEDASNSSGGLFIPSDPHDIVSLPREFGNDQGQAYLCPSSWYRGFYSPITRKHHPDAAPRETLHSRGWAYQERVLARRTLHFGTGAMEWSCSKYFWWQGGVCRTNEDSPRRDFEHLQTAVRRKCKLIYQKTIGESTSNDGSYNKENSEVDCSNSDGSGDEDYFEVTYEMKMRMSRVGLLRSHVTSTLSSLPPLIYTFHEASSGQTLPSVTIDRSTERELFDFVNLAVRLGIYHTWYSTVHSYCMRTLTFGKDKLPALAGIASRFQAITEDEYLAGHWRKELARSLFWNVNYVYQPSKDWPYRTDTYRAPTWSWASVDGIVEWSMPDVGPRGDVPDCVDILTVRVDVQGHNPFGQVIGGSITLQAPVIRATWNDVRSGWTLSSEHDSGWYFTRRSTLRIFSAGETEIRFWIYDDLVHGILPGKPLTVDMTDNILAARRVLPYKDDAAMGLQCPHDLHTLLEKGTYVPKDLLLVKGAHSSRLRFDVLVLAAARSGKNEYIRVGHGQLTHWDELVEEEVTVTVV